MVRLEKARRQLLRASTATQRADPEPRGLLSVGHDEYWSGTQRANVEAARAAGVSLSFFSGNEIYWKTRWESSIDGSGTTHRTLVSYKETHANAKIDPAGATMWTGTWRDPRFSPPGDASPENSLTGQLFMVNDGNTTAIAVPAANGKARFWRNTTVATLPRRYRHDAEWHARLRMGCRYRQRVAPVRLIALSSSTAVNGMLLRIDVRSRHRDPRARCIATAGRWGRTVQWAWGLDSSHDRGSPPADRG
jgi:hypothetical protein